jgi:hypothetical protein
MYFGLCLVLMFMGFVESTILATAYLIGAIHRRLGHLLIVIYRSALNTVNDIALALFVLTYRLATVYYHYHPSRLLKPQAQLPHPRDHHQHTPGSFHQACSSSGARGG